VPLDPLLVPILASLPAPTLPERDEDWPAHRQASLAGADALVEQVMEPGPDVRSVREVRLPVDGGEIGLVVYTPEGAGPHPAHVYLHGGGWVEGSAFSRPTDITCRERAALAGCVVVAVDYRKAPEHRFPAGLNDCYAALGWVDKNVSELGVDPSRITIGGASAGANLAAATALKARDEGGPRISFVLLEAPALDFTFAQPSHELFASGYGLTRDVVEHCRQAYVSPEQHTHPYASPLHAQDLSGLPPTYIMAAELDVLRDEAAAYAERLRAAGVPVVYSLQVGQVHLTAALTKLLPAARSWRDEAVDALRSHVRQS
jgi:acetyl esterase